MTPDDYARVRELYLRALDRPFEEREDFVRQLDAPDPIRAELSALLRDSGTQLIESETGHGAVGDHPRTDPLGVVGATIDGRYRVEAFVAEGGFSFVYRARHAAWTRDVAIKFFKPVGAGPDADKLKASFLHEGALVSELAAHTPNIARSHDVGTHRTAGGHELLFMVLEWLQGETMAQMLRRERGDGRRWGWPIERVMEVLDPIADALRTAHDHGVAHRDIKPSNIHLGPGGTKLLDFGIAKDAGKKGEGFAQTSQHAGAFSVAYAAPEQLDKNLGPTGPWTDVYGLAMLCTELLAGRHPYEDCELLQIIDRARDPSRRPTPRALGVTVSDALEAVLTRALAVTPGERYADVGGFWRALRETLEPTTGSSLQPASSLPAQPPPQPAPRNTIGMLAAALAGGLAVLLLGEVIAPSAPPPSAAAAVVPSTGAGSVERIVPNHLAGFGPLPSHAAAPGTTAEKIALGRKLFWDPVLSEGGALACVSCHQLGGHGVDHRPHAIGHAGREAARNTPSILNVAQAFAFGWDGAVTDLDRQARVPLFADAVMATTEASLMARVRKRQDYVEGFAEAFPEAEPSLTLDTLTAALAAFVRQLYTPGPWDRFLTGDTDAITAEQLRGFELFVETGCVSCHHGPFVGLTGFQRLGLIVPWPRTHDSGRFKVTGHESDMMTFRVPSLRNVEKTAPYFHDGSVKTLPEAIRLMAKHQLGKALDDEQVELIAGWLSTLTGELPPELAHRP